jgi:hypothetical protein
MHEHLMESRGWGNILEKGIFVGNCIYEKYVDKMQLKCICSDVLYIDIDIDIDKYIYVWIY